MPPSRPDYTRQRGLENHPGTILALALTADGKTLVTGGQNAFATQRNWTDIYTQGRPGPVLGTRKGCL